jgi:hypothetical protein
VGQFKFDRPSKAVGESLSRSSPPTLRRCRWEHDWKLNASTPNIHLFPGFSLLHPSEEADEARRGEKKRSFEARRCSFQSCSHRRKVGGELRKIN